MPADNLDKARRATFVEDVSCVLELVAGHFNSAWIIDHLRSAAQSHLRFGQGEGECHGLLQRHRPPLRPCRCECRFAEPSPEHGDRSPRCTITKDPKLGPSYH